MREFADNLHIVEWQPVKIIGDNYLIFTTNI